MNQVVRNGTNIARLHHGLAGYLLSRNSTLALHRGGLLLKHLLRRHLLLLLLHLLHLHHLHLLHLHLLLLLHLHLLHLLLLWVSHLLLLLLHHDLLLLLRHYLLVISHHLLPVTHHWHRKHRTGSACGAAHNHTQKQINRTSLLRRRALCRYYRRAYLAAVCEGWRVRASR